MTIALPVRKEHVAGQLWKIVEADGDELCMVNCWEFKADAIVEALNGQERMRERLAEAISQIRHLERELHYKTL